ncbi:MAG TPA: very short patch repair endonuclease [Solirubrobacterales bacterium]|nr:very short patch repair endonuclease [Solirubrobacterales bacterium]
MSLRSRTRQPLVPISRPHIPPPTPDSAQTRAVMKGNKGQDTGPELAVRSALHASGLRFRKNVRPLNGLRCTADIVFPTERVAVFIDGCFWHSCPQHGRIPKKNSAFWTEKLSRNSARDVRNSAALESAGWTVLRYWEHEQPIEAARAIQNAVLEQRKLILP